jgi:hypothetical protein
MESKTLSFSVIFINFVGDFIKFKTQKKCVTRELKPRRMIANVKIGVSFIISNANTFISAAMTMMHRMMLYFLVMREGTRTPFSRREYGANPSNLDI